jgi:tetratricopeptide (TPR) repeat protein
MKARTWSSAVVLFLAGCSSTPAPQVASEGPPWLPPYSRDQQALLTPQGEVPAIKALRAYPDASRFHYAHDRKLEDPAAAMRATKLVTDLVEESGRLYLMTDTPPNLENRVAQYGPPSPSTPRASAVASRDFQGRLTLREVPLSEDARGALADAEAASAARDWSAAAAHLQTATNLAPTSLEPLARSLELFTLSKDFERLREAARSTLALDPTFAPAHAAKARGFFASGDLASAKESAAQALAYHPTLEDGLRLATELRDYEGSRAPVRAEPYRIFLEVDEVGVVRVGSAPTSGARMYAGCRALMRYELELRAALFDEPEGAPYFLSAAEEMFCTESAIGAYVAEQAVAREHGTTPPEDEQTEALMGHAHTEGLLGFIMFEVLGRHRPDVARTAPRFVHRAMVAYAKRHVLGFEPSLDDRLFAASTLQ